MILWERTGVRNPGWFEISWNRLGCTLALICDYDSDHEWPWMLHVHFLLLNVFLHFPAPRLKPKADKYGEWQQFGVSLCAYDFHFNWGYKSKFYDWPWAWKHVDGENKVLRESGEWVPVVGCWERDKKPDGRKLESFSYRYILRNGEVQYRNAKVHVEQRIWRQRWLWWTTKFQKRVQTIEVEFSDEVGERTGSWKGGTIVCAYEMLPGERVERCLRRMEQNRKFK